MRSITNTLCRDFGNAGDPMSKQIFETRNAIAITDSFICSLDLFTIEVIVQRQRSKRNDNRNTVVMKWKVDRDDDFGSQVIRGSKFCNTNILYLITDQGTYISTTIPELALSTDQTARSLRDTYQRAKSRNIFLGNITEMSDIGFHNVLETDLEEFVDWDYNKHFEKASGMLL